MMYKLLAVASVAQAIPQQPSFEEWAGQYGMNAADEELRASYEEQVKEIDELNARNDGAVYGVNQYSGMSWDEFEATMLTATEDFSEVAGDLPYLGEEPEQPLLVGDVDWDVTPVKDQGSCGSCWAFGTIGAIEAVHKHSSGKEVILSEQQLVDCSGQNCGGGTQEHAMSYLASRDIYTKASYPYTAKNGNCKTGTASGVRISGYKSTAKSDSALASALQNDALTVSIKVDSKFRNYKSGIISGMATPCSHNHAVTLTAFDSDTMKIKNSWGTSFGENGYIRFKRTTAGCGAWGIFTKGGVMPQGETAMEV
jgi:hypothetical protein